MLKPIPEVMTVPNFEGGGIISFHEKDVPVPGPGQLLLQMGANALCGSERGQFYQGSAVTPGHEGAGVVAAAGPETNTPVGTPGAVFLMDYLWKMSQLRAWLHQSMPAETRRLRFQ